VFGPCVASKREIVRLTWLNDLFGMIINRVNPVWT